MTNMTQQTSGTESRQIPIGAKLQSARESMNLDRKDAAAQLRLNENVIDMIENNSFPDDMPHLFIRGYIRSYGKLLQLSDEEIQACLAPLQPKPAAQEAEPQAAAKPAPVAAEPVKSSRALKATLSAGIGIALVSLAVVWWQGQPASVASQPIALQAAEQPERHAALPAGVSIKAPGSNVANPYLAPEVASANPPIQAVGKVNMAIGPANRTEIKEINNIANNA